MESLSLEVLELVIPNLFKVPSAKNPTPRDSKPVVDVALYASISRKWQHAVGHFTMKQIQIYSQDLDTFHGVFTSPRRQELLRKLCYEIDLPTYSANRIYCLEQRREHNANNAALRQGVVHLFNTLESWTTQGAVDLTLGALSPMDHIGDRRSWTLGLDEINC